jgi:hypothetical protein
MIGIALMALVLTLIMQTVLLQRAAVREQQLRAEAEHQRAIAEEEALRARASLEELLRARAIQDQPRQQGERR